MVSIFLEKKYRTHVSEVLHKIQGIKIIFFLSSISGPGPGLIKPKSMTILHTSVNNQHCCPPVILRLFQFDWQMLPIDLEFVLSVTENEQY